MNKNDRNVIAKAYDHIKDWCNFMGLPCDNCPFALPPYDYDEGYFEEGVVTCALADIIFDGASYIGYSLPQEKIDELANRG